MVERTLQDLYVLDDQEPLTLRPTNEIPGDALQSPHDPEATYRKKGGQGHRGYVVNLSETCDPDNPVQLLTSVQLAPNTTDDGQLLKDSLAEQSARGLRIKKMTVDGCYTGETGETACQDHGVQMLPTRIRGRQTAPDRWGWEEYTWLLDDDERPLCGPDFSSLSRWQKPVDDGRTFCQKHPGHRYDPKKHTGCFLCYKEDNGLVPCDHCRFGYRKPQYDKCYPCYFNEKLGITS